LPIDLIVELSSRRSISLPIDPSKKREPQSGLRNSAEIAEKGITSVCSHLFQGFDYGVVEFWTDLLDG